ncbi:MAG TPA: HAMP domain-containing sensor histidine kinase [Candidatus Saccharimonadales bacterium]|jgi:signal transduction histidine kinase|nr:HAMP domain-containing sensor histidine kinase [Candidatus Saccharimonadales bacterium]
MNIPNMQKFVLSTSGRLAGSYLAIIMLMSIGFSIVFYNASSNALSAQVPPPGTFTVRRFNTQDGEIHGGTAASSDTFFQDRIIEGRQALLQRLVILNVLTLAGASVLSYSLARRTLEPIEANMEAQAQFVSDASHELRTPLTALQTTNEVALRRPKITTAEAKELLQNNVEEVVKLKNLTDGLLRLARQDGHSPHTTAVSLQTVASEAMNAVVAPAQAKRIAVQDTVPALRVLGEKPALVQVLVILLDNAIKYSAPKTTIQVDGGRQGRYGYIQVRDAGQGIAATDLPHVFDRFYRADQSRSKKKTDGYGIGLALAKKIVEQYGGDISASSIEGSGATFTFTVPLA